jgi:aryl-alcohol dehydrogenase-like predicted oxidoreductase
MEKRRLGKTSLDVSVLGLGGSEIGFENASPETAATLFNRALDTGINVVDTAECYYKSEELIGHAISSRRNEYFLLTKCGHPRGIESGANWSQESILQSIQRSLQRLRTDHVDIVHLHSCSEAELRKGEAITALQTARDRGYTRFIGYSGDGHAARYAAECGAFDTLQISLNIADQEAIDLTLPLARQNNLGVIAKRPIANAVWRYGHKPIDAYHHEYWNRLQKLKYDFVDHLELESAVSVALRFTLSIPGVHTAIVGTAKPERLPENARLLDRGRLDDEQFQTIRERWEDVAPRIWIGQI